MTSHEVMYIDCLQLKQTFFSKFGHEALATSTS